MTALSYHATPTRTPPCRAGTAQPDLATPEPTLPERTVTALTEHITPLLNWPRPPHRTIPYDAPPDLVRAITAMPNLDRLTRPDPAATRPTLLRPDRLTERCHAPPYYAGPRPTTTALPSPTSPDHIQPRLDRLARPKLTET